MALDSLMEMGAVQRETMAKCILMIGCLDTKAQEYALLRELILGRGHRVLTVNIAALGTTNLLPVDVEADEVALAGGSSIAEIRARRDHGFAMKAMHDGAPVVVRALHDQGRFDGIVGMGGGSGTAVIASAMRALPLGVPKVCLTTMVNRPLQHYAGTKDLVLIPSIVDVAGLNRISRPMIARAAGAVCGMVEASARRAPAPSAADAAPPPRTPAGLPPAGASPAWRAAPIAQRVLEAALLGPR